MENRKIFFSGNVKFLRERKKISQEVLALALNISRAKLAAIELGQTKSPQPEDYLNVSEYFKISVDSLLKVDLKKLGELKVRELEAGNDVYMAGGNIRILAITVDQRNRENVEYVPVKAKAGYKAGYSDPGYITALPKYSFPDLPKNGTYRMFPTTGDSMLPIPEGSDILTRYVQDWTSIKAGTPCIVILNGEQDFVFKKITVQTDGAFLLQSFNESYQPYTEESTNIIEVWQFVKFISSQIPQNETELQNIKRMFSDIKDELGRINR